MKKKPGETQHNQGKQFYSHFSVLLCILVYFTALATAQEWQYQLQLDGGEDEDDDNDDDDGW